MVNNEELQYSTPFINIFFFSKKKSLLLLFAKQKCYLTLNWYKWNANHESDAWKISVAEGFFLKSRFKLFVGYFLFLLQNLLSSHLFNSDHTAESKTKTFQIILIEKVYIYYTGISIISISQQFFNSLQNFKLIRKKIIHVEVALNQQHI